MRNYITPAFLSEHEEEKTHELEQRIDCATDWFQETIEIMYGKKPFSEGDLENALDNLASYLRCKLPRNDLQVTCKTETIQKTA